MQTLELGSTPYRVELISSSFERTALIAMVSQNPAMVAACALGRCLPDLGLQQHWHQCHGSITKYGAMVGDALLARGHNAAEIIEGGMAVVQAHRSLLVPTDAQIEVARGNSTAPPDVPTA